VSIPNVLRLPRGYKYPSFFDRHFGGHISFDLGPKNPTGYGWLSVVLYGFNAMHVALNVRAFGWWWCFHPTFRVFGAWWPWYFYASRDATPTNRDGNLLFHLNRRRAH
jgi:hypothetical protein